MPTYVWTDITGTPELIGAAECAQGRGVFAYAPRYLASDRPAIDPLNIPLSYGQQVTAATGGVARGLADASLRRG